MLSKQLEGNKKIVNIDFSPGQQISFICCSDCFFWENLISSFHEKFFPMQEFQEFLIFGQYWDRFEQPILQADSYVRAKVYSKAKEVVHQIHEQGLVHADFDGRNLSLKDSEVSVVDFFSSLLRSKFLRNKGKVGLSYYFSPWEFLRKSVQVLFFSPC